MKQFKKASIVFMIITVFIACSDKENKPIDLTRFKSPVSSSKVHTWWHWMDNCITKDGITRDLEAMQQKGINEATILNIGLFNDKEFDVPEVIFNTREWYEMFLYALEEAERLNIKIGFHNCDGWSSSGGPWITPEHAMKQIVWNKSHVTGGEHVNKHLPKPFAMMGFYEDVAILAMKSGQKPNSFIQAAPLITINDTMRTDFLYDGCPVSGVEMAKGYEVKIDYTTPALVEKIAIHPRRRFSWRDITKIRMTFSVWAKNASQQWEKITDIETKGINNTQSFNIPATKASSFKLKVEHFNDQNSWIPFTIGELELLKKDETPLYHPALTNIQEKTGSVLGATPEAYSKAGFNQKSTTTSTPEIIDLTDKTDKSGRLKWDAPAGEWTIIRFGYTLTGAKNGPATKAGTGLEVDKMDTTSLNLHYNSFPKKLVVKAGNHAGNTFKFLLIDSWECSFQNWTGNFPDAFKKLHGYDIKQWIPVLCGEIIDNAAQSEAFLHDFRGTIASLIENNYYKHFSELCHKDNLEMHCEVIYGGGKYPSLDILKANSYADMPMFEFWAGNNQDAFIEYNPSERPEAHFPANAALFYDKTICGSEAYTGFAHYSESPWELKVYGDRAYCSGINQMILHSYVHQPNEQKPGFTLYNWGLAFNRHNTYWNHVSGWMNYQARLQYVLQNTTQASDFLYYVGDQLPQFNDEKHQPSLPAGFHKNICNYDILSKMKVVDGLLKYKNKLTFKMLVLPKQETMHYQTLLKLEALIKQGATVYGKKPVGVLSRNDLNNNKKAFTALADKIWGKNTDDQNTANYGKGRVIWGMPLAKAIRQAKISPDFKPVTKDSAAFLFIHKQSADKDIYFVVNQLNQPVTADCYFRITGKQPQLWDAKDGTMAKITHYEQKENNSLIPWHFKPREATLFVFSDDPDPAVPALKPKAKKTQEITDFNGSIEFLPAYEAEINNIEIHELKPLSSFEQNSIKYFAGQAKYTIQFQTKADAASANGDVYLNLGKLDAAASVVLNGQELGTVFSPNRELKVTGILQAENTLKVTVAIPYRNRFIGDYIEYGEPKNIWTSAYINNFLGADKPLKAVGLTGPVKLVYY